MEELFFILFTFFIAFVYGYNKLKQNCYSKISYLEKDLERYKMSNFIDFVDNFMSRQCDSDFKYSKNTTNFGTTFHCLNVSTGVTVDIEYCTGFNTIEVGRFNLDRNPICISLKESELLDAILKKSQV